MTKAWFTDPSELVKPKQFIVPSSKGGIRKLINFCSVLLVLIAVALKKMMPRSDLWYKVLSVGGLLLVLFNFIFPPDNQISIGKTTEYEDVDIPDDYMNIYSV